jgi:hypothetical protein
MRNRRPSVLMIAFVVGVSVSDLSPVAASSDLGVNSREYKLMLEVSRFRGLNPLSVIDEMWNGPIRQLIQGLDGIEVKDGVFKLKKDRAVRFWDTGGGECTLRKHGYAFRERVKVKKGKEADKKREVTLKYRNPEAERVTVKDMLGAHPDAKQKFEMDIGIGSSPDSQLRFVYSKSTTQPIGKNRKINKMQDPLELYPKLANGLREEGASVDPDRKLERVSGVTIREHVYEEPVVDLGDREAEVSVTLWYDAQEGGLTEPTLAELSFKIEASGQAPAFSTATLDRADALFLAMASLPWADANASTKTSFIYQYRNFCS